MKNDELTVRTPLGELVVGIKADPDYPGIAIAFRSFDMVPKKAERNISNT